MGDGLCVVPTAMQEKNASIMSNQKENTCSKQPKESVEAKDVSDGEGDKECEKEKTELKKKFETVHHVNISN